MWQIQVYITRRYATRFITTQFPEYDVDVKNKIKIMKCEKIIPTY